MERNLFVSVKNLYQWEQNPEAKISTANLEADFPEHSELRPRLAALMIDRGASLTDLPEFLRESYLAQEWKGEHHLHAYRKIWTSFSEHLLEFFPLKGIWMALKVLKHPTLRYASDLDIWIEPKNLSLAKNLLTQLGYKEENQLHNRIHFHHVFRHENTGLMVELHTSLATHDFTNLPSEEIWARSMDVEDQLVYIFYHAALHQFDRPARLLDLTDVLAWAEKKGVNMEEALARAEKWQCRRLFLLAFGACGWMMDRPIQEEAQKLFANFLKNRDSRMLSRLKLTDGVWPAVRGTLHPARILGGLVDRLETR